MTSGGNGPDPIDNKRRGELIEKQIARTITPTEQEELASMNDIIDDWLEDRYPQPLESEL